MSVTVVWFRLNCPGSRLPSPALGVRYFKGIRARIELAFALLSLYSRHLRRQGCYLNFWGGCTARVTVRAAASML